MARLWLFLLASQHSQRRVSLSKSLWNVSPNNFECLLCATSVLGKCLPVLGYNGAAVLPTFDLVALQLQKPQVGSVAAHLY